MTPQIEHSFAVYDWIIIVTLEWVTVPGLEWELQYVNSRGARAVLEGVVISDDPGRHHRPFDATGSPARYDWKPYEVELRNARRRLERMRTLLRRYEEIADQPVIRAAQDSADPRWSEVQNLVHHAGTAMEHALRAAIWAAGGSPGTATP